ncbi:MAG TPA: transglutaminaseTgpA domain-containing protein [Longimicrobium sp.]|nr:transglutaminaseTgpA domain-containing protein [Longimicrobium sp.]
MSIALLHRRLTAAMSLAALLAFMAGAGASPWALVAASALAIATLRLPSPEWSAWIERGIRVVIVALCGWMLYVAFVLGQDFMPAVMAMLLFLLGGESLRPVDARNDTRLYLLSFSLLLASTAYYPGLGFGAAFVAFVVLSTLALTVGYLRRQSERFGIPGVRLGRRMMAAVAALSVVTLLVSVALFLIFPRLPRQWNVQGRRGGGDMMAGFSNEVRLGQHGGRIVNNPQVAFRVEFLDGVPAQTGGLYWRGRSFDRFDGVVWSRTRGLMGPSYVPAFYGRRWGGPFRRMRIFGGPPDANVLFGSHPILNIQARSAIRVFQDYTGDMRFAGSDAPVYTVTSGGPRPPERALQASDGPDGRAADPYLQLPEDLDPRVGRLADSLVAGAATRVDRVRAVERYLSEELAYTLELPETRGDATIEGFLFRRRAGHCEYFSSAMVMLLRSAGIPSRNVTGFLGGEWNAFGDYLAVTGNDAHSWVEVWFAELGWVPFDPTPSARNALVAEGADGGWWSAALWFDGLEYRWYKWVIDYDLEKQLGLFIRVSDLFSRDGRRGVEGGGAGVGGASRGVAVVIALGVAAALLWSFRRRRRAPVTEETRAYLALRRAYARVDAGGNGGPLEFAERVVAQDAPGAAPAAALVRLYVRARFGGEEIGDVGRARMRQALEEARAALRAAGRRRA